MEKKVLVLGAGRVVKPMIDYFFKYTTYKITIASLEIADNLHFIKEHPRGNFLCLSIDNEQVVKQNIAQHDIVISLLPAHLHVKVANICLESKKNLVTASYVSPEMQSLHDEAVKNNLLFLNEIGLDPGIDHILAKYMIDLAQKDGGKVISFFSYCGGLPAPQSNDNPVGYKFSWSPMAVMQASKNSARFLRDGQEVIFNNIDVFKHKQQISIQDTSFFAYANRNSLKYQKLYDLKDAKNIMRCTLRYGGWCEFIESLLQLNFLEEMPIIQNTKGMSAAEFTAKVLSCKDISAVYSHTESILQTDMLPLLEWLGLFDNNLLLEQQQLSPIEFIVELSTKKMLYKPGEKDMIVLHNSIEVAYPDYTKKMEISLVDYEEQDSAMARTVSLPVAIATELILEGKVSHTGVQIPTFPSIYNPMIDKLKKLGIRFYEKL